MRPHAPARSKRNSKQADLFSGAAPASGGRAGRGAKAEDPNLPHVKRFTDGYRVWNPMIRAYVGDATMSAFQDVGLASDLQRSILVEMSQSGAASKRVTSKVKAMQEAPSLFGSAPAARPTGEQTGFKFNPFVVVDRSGRPVIEGDFASRKEAGLARRYLESSEGGPSLRVRSTTPSENLRAGRKRNAAKAAFVPPPRTLVQVELLGDHPAWRDARVVRFTAIPSHYGKGKAPRYAINRMIVETVPGASLQVSPEAVVFRGVAPTDSGGGAAATAVAALAERLHGDPRALRAQVEYARKPNMHHRTPASPARPRGSDDWAIGRPVYADEVRPRQRSREYDEDAISRLKPNGRGASSPGLRMELDTDQGTVTLERRAGGRAWKAVHDLTFGGGDGTDTQFFCDGVLCLSAVNPIKTKEGVFMFDDAASEVGYEGGADLDAFERDVAKQLVALHAKLKGGTDFWRLQREERFVEPLPPLSEWHAHKSRSGHVSYEWSAEQTDQSRVEYLIVPGDKRNTYVATATEEAANWRTIGKVVGKTPEGLVKTLRAWHDPLTVGYRPNATTRVKSNPGRRTLSATVERCVAHVAPKRVDQLGPRDGLSSAIAICTAQGQRLGRLHAGTRTPTAKGRRDDRNARRRVGFRDDERAVAAMARNARKPNAAKGRRTFEQPEVRRIDGELRFISRHAPGDWQRLALEVGTDLPVSDFASAWVGRGMDLDEVRYFHAHDVSDPREALKLRGKDLSKATPPTARARGRR